LSQLNGANVGSLAQTDDRGRVLVDSTLTCN
jgi:hypothetical protein